MVASYQNPPFDPGQIDG